jgi:hypothetical protein
MTRNFPFWTKVKLIFGLNLFFYPVQVWVNNLDERQFPTLRALFTDGWSILFNEYFFGSVAMLLWFLVAEKVHGWMEQLFGDYQLGTGLRNALIRFVAILIMMGALYGMFELATRSVYWLEGAIGKANPVLVFRDEYHYRRFRFGFSLYAIFGLLVFYLMAYRRMFEHMTEANLRMERAENERREHQYALLRQQVNPHFLFNSLSTLSSMAAYDPELSEQFIDRLAKAYRYMLEHRSARTAPLREELAFFDAVSFVYRCRFGSKLRIRTEVPEQVVATAGIVPLSLQVVSEHILKHHRMSQGQPLEIRIGIDGDALCIRNTCQPRPEPDHAIAADLKRLEARYLEVADRFISVGDQFEGESHLGLEVFVRFQAVTGDAEDQAVGLREAGHRIPKVGAFGGASRRVVFGIEVEHHDLAGL